MSLTNLGRALNALNPARLNDGSYVYVAAGEWFSVTADSLRNYGHYLTRYEDEESAYQSWASDNGATRLGAYEDLALVLVPKAQL